MLDRYVRRLALDRRLLQRPGWISEQAFAEAMETLPDTADKAEWLGPEERSDAAREVGEGGTES